MNLRKFIRQTLEENFGDNYDFSKHSFTSGDCDIYAVSLHRLYGYPLYVVRGWYHNYLELDLGQDERELEYEDCHIVVKLPNGMFLDSLGEQSEEELQQKARFMNNVEKITVEPISEEDALSAFSCQDQEPEIKQVMDYIKSKDVIEESSVGDFNYDAVKKAIQGAINNGSINIDDISPDKYFIVCFGMFNNHISTVSTFDKEEVKNLVKYYKNQDDVWKIYIEKPTLNSMVLLRKENKWIIKK